MQHQTGHFKTAQQQSIFHQCWLPEGDAPAVIVLVHGLGEHSGRYGNLLEVLLPQGYAVHALDHIGHGQSDGIRKHVKTFDDFLHPLHTFSAMVRAQHPDKPMFLLGHSMGGLIAARYLLDHQHAFSGAVLSAPALQPGEPPSPFVVFAGRLLVRLFPRLRMVGLSNATLSRDPQLLQAFADDPLNYSGKSTLSLGVALMAAMEYVRANAAQISLPMLVLQGSGDRMVHPAGAQLLHDVISSPDKTFNIYEGWYHELFNEPERAAVLADVLNWLNRRR